MANIQPYESKVLPQGGLSTRQATAADMGFGQGVSALGQGLEAYADARYRADVENDMANLSVTTANTEAKLARAFVDASNQAQPGTTDFEEKFGGVVGQTLQDTGAQFKTPVAQRAFAVKSAQMKSEYTQKAIQFQAHLDGQNAQLRYNDLVTGYGQAAMAAASSKMATKETVDSTFNSLLTKGYADIDNKDDATYARVPQTVRDSLKQKFKQDLAKATLTGWVHNHPGELANTLSPEVAEQFKPYENLLKGNATTGGRLDISKNTMQWAPDVTVAASSRGVAPNILIAQIDQESRGKPNAINRADAAVTGSPSVGLAQFQPGTAQRYGIDPTDPKQAIKGQAAYMADLLKMFGGDYQKALAGYNWGEGNVQKAMQRWGDAWLQHAPTTTQKYVAEIMVKAGMVPSDAVQVPNTPQQDDLAGTPKQPVTNAPLAAFNVLSWEDQNQLINTDVRLAHMKLENMERARILADKAKKEQQEAEINKYVTRILDPDKNGGVPTEAEIAANPLLSGEQKQHISSYMLSHGREVEGKAHPAEVRSLMMQIHAADNDPTKTYNMDPIMESYRLGKISTNEMKFLRQEVEQLRDGSSNSFTKDVHMAREFVFQSLSRSIEGQVQPEMAADASYRFMFDLQKAIDEKRKKNEDPRSLLTPGDRDYMLKPERIKSYMLSSKLAIANTAGTIVKQESSQLPTYKEYDKLKPGDSFVDDKGNVRIKR